MGLSTIKEDFELDEGIAAGMPGCAMPIVLSLLIRSVRQSWRDTLLLRQPATASRHGTELAALPPMSANGQSGASSSKSMRATAVGHDGRRVSGGS
jgi:hypothetical protein